MYVWRRVLLHSLSLNSKPYTGVVVGDGAVGKVSLVVQPAHTGKPTQREF